METSVPQARTTQPPPTLSDFFPPPPVEPIVVELPISPPVKHAMLELPMCPVVAETLHGFEFVPPPQKNELLKGLTQRHKKRQKVTSVPKVRTTLLPPCQLDFFPPPQGCQWAQNFLNSPPPQDCQTAQNGVNPYSMRAVTGAPMGKYPGYPCTTTKAGSGISDASLVHMLRPLSPMRVPEDDGGWDSAGDHPRTPFYMG
nr:amyloid beta A4 precursor protein-binding family B member 1-interacting protein-like [Oncorhynchus nerka]